MEKNFKKIIRIERSVRTHMVGDGFKVSQLMPGYNRNMTPETSPFLMLDYNAPLEVSLSPIHRRGVDYHPHRGFETVTIVYSGEIEHRDTSGNHGIITPGEVQWMTAGSGLLHEEKASENFAKNGGIQHFVQLWIDLPKEYKMTEPRYQALTNEKIPEIPFESGKIRLFAWEYNNEKWAAKTFSLIELYDVRFDKIGKLDLHFPKNFNAMILVVEGEILLSEKEFSHGDFVYLSQAWEDVEIFSKNNSTKILVMAGLPLGQNVVNYWPFVMTSPEEIMQAFKDLNDGKMGRIS